MNKTTLNSQKEKHSMLSLRRATLFNGCFPLVMGHFYPRSPCGERLKCARYANTRCVISIHALLAESDWRTPSAYSRTTYFYPRSPCGERLPQLGIIQPVADISIHALLAESDRTGRSCSTCHPHFYPRSPCGERRCMMVRSLVTVAFLSTLSLRRATRKTQRPYVKDSISIHALLAESDTTGCPTDTSLKAFLSTLSLRRATSLFCPLPYPYRYFYPRSPQGERG